MRHNIFSIFSAFVLAMLAACSFSEFSMPSYY